MTSGDAFAAIEKSLGPGEEILWHSAQDPNGVAATRKFFRIFCLGAVLALLVIGFGLSMLEHKGTWTHGPNIRFVGYILLRFSFPLILFEIIMRFKPVQHYALTNVRAISIAEDNKSLKELDWLSVSQITLAKNFTPSPDLIFTPRGTSNRLRFQYVSDAPYVYELATLARNKALNWRTQTDQLNIEQ